MISTYPHCYIITGATTSCIYDLVANRVLEIDLDLAVKLRGHESSTFSQRDLDEIERLKNIGLVFDSEYSIFSEKLRWGVPQHLRKFYSGGGTRISDLFLVITGRCPLACYFCGQESGSTRLTGCRRSVMRESLLINDYKQIMEEAKVCGAKNIHILGGEPLLLPDLTKELAEAAKAQSYESVFLYTTATKITESIIRDFKVDWYVVHLAAHTTELFGKVCGSDFKTEFEQGIDLLKRAGKRIFINICVTPETFRSFKELDQYVQSLGSNGYGYSHIYGLETDPEYTACLYDFRKGLSRFSDLTFFHSRQYHPCLYGKLSVFADGSVSVCPMMKSEKIGDLSIESILTVLQGGQYLRYWELNLDKIDGCQSCGYRYACLDCRAVEAAATRKLTGKKYCSRIGVR
jgi:radical SAM protein with 4Fe4S-binding SPASM domain